MLYPNNFVRQVFSFYYRFKLNHRDIEELLFWLGTIVSREAIYVWCIEFVVICSRRLKRRRAGYGDTFYIDEVFVKINCRPRDFRLCILPLPIYSIC